MGIKEKRFTDYFDLLEVDRNASKEDVQKAFMLKASIWHPDKAETDEDKEYFTRVYQDLQTAYKILSNDSSRKQYIDAQQTTDIEFKFADRDLGYVHTDQFKTKDGKFDSDAFQKAFDETRDQAEGKAMEQLQTEYNNSSKVTHSDYTSLLDRRAAELKALADETDMVFSGTGANFDSNTFNRAFDFMKERSPGKGVQLYEGNPMAMFSGGGLEECDPVSGIHFSNGTNFMGDNLDNLVAGQSVNPGKDLDLKALQTGEQYGKESKLTNEELQRKLKSIQNDRENLATMDKSKFIVEPSEIELLYSDLFQPLDIEGLEAPVGSGTDDAISAALDEAEQHIPKDSGKIRKKIEQKKRFLMEPKKIHKNTLQGSKAEMHT